MNEKNILLVSGCPRSGTSWVHFLVAAHPDTFTVRETHLYDKYIGPIKSWFDKEEQFQGSDGLSNIFSERGFVEDILVPIVNTSFSKITSLADNQHTIIEKTPGNLLHHRLIREIQPNARLLVVFRDPRAVYSSFKAGSLQNWGGWMKKSVSEFCSSWNKYAISYLTARSYWPEDRLKLVKYEDMKNAGEHELSNIYSWAGLKEVEGLPSKALTENNIEKLKQAKKGTLHHESRNNFYRAGKIYGWVEELSFAEIREIEEHSSDLMHLLGYKVHKLNHKK